MRKPPLTAKVFKGLVLAIHWTAMSSPHDDPHIRRASEWVGEMCKWHVWKEREDQIKATEGTVRLLDLLERERADLSVPRRALPQPDGPVKRKEEQGAALFQIPPEERADKMQETSATSPPWTSGPFGWALTWTPTT